VKTYDLAGKKHARFFGSIFQADTEQRNGRTHSKSKSSTAAIRHPTTNDAAFNEVS
jgi:hypothetical protein